MICLPVWVYYGGPSHRNFLSPAVTLLLGLIFLFLGGLEAWDLVPSLGRLPGGYSFLGHLFPYDLFLLFGCGGGGAA